MSRPSLTWFKLAVAAATVAIGAVLAWGMARNDPWTWFHVVASGPEAARALPVRLPPPFEPLEASLDNLVAIRPLRCTGSPLIDLDLVEQFAIADWGSDTWVSFMVVVDDPASVATMSQSFIDPLCDWEGGSFERLDIGGGWPGPAIGYSFSDPDQGRVVGAIATAVEGNLLIVVQHEALEVRPPSSQTRSLVEIARERARRPFRAWIVPAFFGAFLVVGAGALWFPRYVLAMWVANAAFFVIRSPWILALLALIAFGVFAGRSYRQVARRISLERADPDAAPDPAVAQLGEQLESMGFLPVGMVRFKLDRTTSIWPVLLNPDRTSFAVCNDRFVTVISRFGPRLLVTIGSGHAAVSPTVLRTTVVGGPLVRWSMPIADPSSIWLHSATSPTTWMNWP